MVMELTRDIQSAVYENSMILDATVKTVYVETFGPDYDEGMFPPENKGLWTRFLNKVEKDGIRYLTKRCAYKSNEVKIKNDGDKLIYEFKKPIKAKTGFQIKNGEKVDVISEITYLEIECDYDYYYRRGHDGPREIQISGKIIEIK